MRFGPRATLFLVALGLSVAVLVPGGLYLRHELRASLVDRIERELVAQLAAARILFETAAIDRPDEIDPLAERLGAAVGLRITIIAPDGAVIGDTDVSSDQLAAVENHGDRPEVREALRAGAGSSRRWSSTVSSELLYVASPYRTADGSTGVIRVARQLDEVDDALARLSWLLVIAGVLSIGASVILSAAAAHLVSRPMRELVASARAIAETGLEPTALAGSLERMKREIERTVTTLAAERARTAAVLESMSEGVIALDRDGRITLLNRAAGELLAVAGGAVGRSLLEVVRAPALDELMARAEPDASVELELPATRRRLLARRAPHQAGGAVIVLHDVTALHRLETIRRDFVANVSHELRTPVSVISANAETLVDGALADRETAPRLVDAIHRNAVRLTDLIDGLLDLSRLEAGRYAIDLEEVALAAAARRAADAVERLAERRGVSISLAVPDGLTAAADPRALQQVLVNLLENAIKHTPEGSRVEVVGEADGERSAIEVRDDGPGIPPGQRERIFERFYRIDPGRSREMGGTGLGLSIVKHLVDAMDGRVQVRDNLPRGAIFRVELPRRNS